MKSKTIGRKLTLVMVVLLLVIGLAAYAETAGPCPQGGTFVIACSTEPPSLLLGSTRGSGIAQLQITSLVYPNLVDLDLKFNPIPGLAQRWEVSSDKLTYTFHLYPDAVWADGHPITAEDVQYTRGLWQKYPGSRHVPFKSDRVIDRHTYEMTLTRPFPQLLTMMGTVVDRFSVRPKHLLGPETDAASLDKSPLNHKPVSGGPFLFKEWVRGDHIKLVRNPNYYHPGRPCVDSLIIKFLTDKISTKNAILGGDVDFVYSYQIPLESVAQFKKDPRFQIVEGGLGVAVNDMLVFNLQKPYLKNKKVRHAIAHAINRDQYNKLAFFGAGKIAHSILNSVLPQYTAKFDVYDFNPAKANQLLDEAGFPKGSDGVRFSLELKYQPNRAFEERGASIVKSNLEDVGIKVNLMALDYMTLYDVVYRKFDFDMIIQLRTTGPVPATIIPILIGKPAIGAVAANGGKYVNEELEAMWSKLATENNQEDWDRVQQIAMEDLPWYPMAEFPNIQFGSSKFGNLVTTAIGYLGAHENVYLRKKK